MKNPFIHWAHGVNGFSYQTYVFKQLTITLVFNIHHLRLKLTLIIYICHVFRKDRHPRILKANIRIREY